MNLLQNKPLARSENIVVQELENEILIYDLNINKAFCLNQTSAFVWQNCDGTKTVAEISDLISKKLKTQVNQDFVWLAIEELKKDNLLENGNELANHFGEMSRREIVKKVGLASMIALPVVTSLVAPTAVFAQSGVALGGACTTSQSGSQGNCQTNLRCFNSVCEACTPNGLPAPGGCTLADLSGARRCCSQTCSLSTNLCTA